MPEGAGRGSSAEPRAASGYQQPAAMSTLGAGYDGELKPNAHFQASPSLT